MRFQSVGAFLGALGVIFGAFGAHSLPNLVAADQLARSTDLWKTGASYHLIHAVALVLVGLLQTSHDTRSLRAAGWLFIVGIAIFSGTLYAMALGAPTWLGAITPLGGLSFIVGWIALGVATRRPA